MTEISCGHEPCSLQTALSLHYMYTCHYITSIFVITLQVYLSLHYMYICQHITCIFHCVTFHYNYITLHWKAGIALNCMTLHCIAVLQWQCNAWYCVVLHDIALVCNAVAVQGIERGVSKERAISVCLVLHYVACQIFPKYFQVLPSIASKYCHV